MSEKQNPEEFYEKLKTQLYETATWPSEYLYKFIVKSDLQKISEIEALFNNIGAVINTIESKNGNYTSISIHVLMKDPDAVITKYKEVAENVEGVISL
jgi:putative lipoic acid-binding regulatory protein